MSNEVSARHAAEAAVRKVERSAEGKSIFIVKRKKWKLCESDEVFFFQNADSS